MLRPPGRYGSDRSWHDFTSCPEIRGAIRGRPRCAARFAALFAPLLAPLLALLITVLGACTTTPPAPAGPLAPATPLPPARAQLREAGFDSLPGWASDDLRAAWPAFLNSCKALRSRPAWRAPCAVAGGVAADDNLAIRNFFETRFTVQELRDSNGASTGLVTGYYEPLLRGSRTRRPPYLTPLYGVPDDLLTIDLSSVYPQLAGMRLRGRLLGNKVVPYADRHEIVSERPPRGKEIVWVDNPVEAFFLQIQGSGRVDIDDSNAKPPGRRETIRLGYADQNGHPYKSIGRWLVDQGQMTIDQVSMQSIAAWAAAHPERLSELLDSNPSYVFFRESAIADAAVGPNGALGVPLTPQRSIAVDPASIPLGTPVFLETTEPSGSQPLQRLVMAQDTGGAIRGVIRADYFWGFGDAAGQQAGRMKQQGRIWLLLPR